VSVVRAAAAADFAGILSLNEADVSHLSPLSAPGLERLATIAAYFSVAQVEGRLAGFLLALASAAVHDSANFLWFKQRYAEFLYVDRVVVAVAARRGGIASQLYRDLEARAISTGISRITCEINLRPPNPQSVAFHDRHGYVEVGTKETEDGTKTLSMRIKELTR
jgi:uncharacterized protein